MTLSALKPHFVNLFCLLEFSKKVDISNENRFEGGAVGSVFKGERLLTVIGAGRKSIQFELMEMVVW